MNVHLSMSLPGYQSFEEHTGVANADYVLEYFSKAKEIGLECTANITVTKRTIMSYLRPYRLPSSMELQKFFSTVFCLVDVV